MEIDELQRELRECTQRCLDLHNRLSSHYQTVARDPTPGGAAEARLFDLIEQRREALAALGMVALRAALGGQELQLSGLTEGEGPTLQEDVRTSEPVVVVTRTPTVVTRRRERAVVVEEPKGPPASAGSLEGLSRSGIGPNWQAPASTEAQKAHLQDILQGLAEPRPIGSMEDYHAEVERLLHACSDIESWIRLPKVDQRSLVGMCATRSRHLQDEAAPALGAPREAVSHLNMAFSLLTRYSAEKRPGFVKGLSRNQRPDVGLTWLDHAVAWWDQMNSRVSEPLEVEPDHTAVISDLRLGLEEDREPDVVRFLIQRCVDAGMSSSDSRLVELLVGYPSVLEGQAAFKTLRTRIKESLAEEEVSTESTDQASPVPEDWPHWDHTRAKAAILVGGDTRPMAADRIQAAFGFAELEWERGWRVRKVESLAKRIESGKVDLVILLRRFMSHWVFDHIVPACRSAEVPFAVVDTGYGVVQIQRALERYLADDE